MAGKDQVEAFEAQIERLPDLSYAELKERWQKLFGNPPPKHISRQLLEKAIAYSLREKVLGGLSPETKRRLRQIAAAVREGREDSLSLGPRIRLGTRLVRAWQGETHIVDVLNDGFEWKGTRYGSLSAIAKAITGTNWNGYAFFGVKRRPTHNKNAAGPRKNKVQTAETPTAPAASSEGDRSGAV